MTKIIWLILLLAGTVSANTLPTAIAYIVVRTTEPTVAIEKNVCMGNIEACYDNVGADVVGRFGSAEFQVIEIDNTDPDWLGKWDLGDKPRVP